MVREEALGLASAQHAPGRHEALSVQSDLASQPSFDVGEPPGPATPARGDDGFAGDGVVADHPEDGLPLEPGPPARVDQEEKAATEQEAESRVIDVNGEPKEGAQKPARRRGTDSLRGPPPSPPRDPAAESRTAMTAWARRPHSGIVVAARESTVDTAKVGWPSDDRH